MVATCHQWNASEQLCHGSWTCVLADTHPKGLFPRCPKCEGWRRDSDWHWTTLDLIAGVRDCWCLSGGLKQHFFSSRDTVTPRGYIYIYTYMWLYVLYILITKEYSWPFLIVVDQLSNADFRWITLPWKSTRSFDYIEHFTETNLASHEHWEIARR